MMTLDVAKGVVAAFRVGFPEKTASELVMHDQSFLAAYAITRKEDFVQLRCEFYAELAMSCERDFLSLGTEVSFEGIKIRLEDGPSSGDGLYAQAAVKDGRFDRMLFTSQQQLICWLLAKLR